MFGFEIAATTLELPGFRSHGVVTDQVARLAAEVSARYFTGRPTRASFLHRIRCPRDPGNSNPEFGDPQSLQLRTTSRSICWRPSAKATTHARSVEPTPQSVTRRSNVARPPKPGASTTPGTTDLGTSTAIPRVGSRGHFSPQSESDNAQGGLRPSQSGCPRSRLRTQSGLSQILY